MSDLDIRVYTQNCIKLKGAQTVYFDPFKVTDEPHDADMVFVTHDHYDHYSPADIRKVINDRTVFVVPEPMAGKVKKMFSGHDVKGLAVGEKTEADGIVIETVASYNKIKPFHPKKAGWLGYIIEIEDKRVYVSGDTDKTAEAESVKCDIAFVPIGGFYTMNVKEAAELINIIKPELAIPTHYGSAVGKPSFGKDFAKLVEDDIQVIEKIENY